MSRITTQVLRDLVPSEPIFTTRRAVTRTGAQLSAVSRALASLARQGLITRLGRGLWAEVRNSSFSPYAVVPWLLGDEPDTREPTGYVSFVSALHLHGIVSQIPAAIHVAVRTQRPSAKTPVARYTFHQIAPECFGGFKPGDAYGRFQLATPAKAMVDTLYLSARRARRFHALPELTWDEGVPEIEIRHWIAAITYQPLRAAVESRWAKLRPTAQQRAPTRRLGTTRNPSGA